MLRLRQAVLLLSILPVLLMFHNNVSNWHYHQGLNGQGIRHAHPIASNGQSSHTPCKPDHDHSAAEMLFFDMITDMSVLLLLAVFLHVFIARLKTHMGKSLCTLISLPLFLIPLLRAPPAFRSI